MSSWNEGSTDANPWWFCSFIIFPFVEMGISQISGIWFKILSLNVKTNMICIIQELLSKISFELEIKYQK